MNEQQLKKNVGDGLRPYPLRVDSYGSTVSVLSSDGPRYEKHGPSADYDWVLEEVNSKTVTLACPFTGHRVTLR